MYGQCADKKGWWMEVKGDAVLYGMVESQEGHVFGSNNVSCNCYSQENEEFAVASRC